MCSPCSLSFDIPPHRALHNRRNLRLVFAVASIRVWGGHHATLFAPASHHQSAASSDACSHTSMRRQRMTVRLSSVRHSRVFHRGVQPLFLPSHTYTHNPNPPLTCRRCVRVCVCVCRCGPSSFSHVPTPTRTHNIIFGRSSRRCNGAACTLTLYGYGVVFARFIPRFCFCFPAPPACM